MIDDKNQPLSESIKRAWNKHNLEHFRYFRSLSLRTKLEAVEGMADIVRRFQELSTQRKIKNSTNCSVTTIKTRRHAGVGRHPVK